MAEMSFLVCRHWNDLHLYLYTHNKVSVLPLCLCVMMMLFRHPIFNVMLAHDDDHNGINGAVLMVFFAAIASELRFNSLTSVKEIGIDAILLTFCFLSYLLTYIVHI